MDREPLRRLESSRGIGHLERWADNMSIAPITEYPLAWMLAAMNLGSLLFAIIGAGVLVVRQRRFAWLPIGTAFLVTYGLSWASHIRAGLVPVVPYLSTGSVSLGEGSIPSISVSYRLDVLSVGLALSVAVALRRSVSRPIQALDPTRVSRPVIGGISED